MKSFLAGTLFGIVVGAVSVRAPQAGIEIVNIVCRTTACEIQTIVFLGRNLKKPNAQQKLSS